MFRQASLMLTLSCAFPLAGCVTVPARPRLISGELLPETLIGTGRLIEAGQSTIADAVHLVQTRSGRNDFLIAADAGSVALPYALCVGTRVMPFVDASEALETRWLVLSFSSDGIVTGSQTFDRLPAAFAYWPRDRVFVAGLDAKTRDRLKDDGLLLTETQYDRVDLIRHQLNP